MTVNTHFILLSRIMCKADRDIVKTARNLARDYGLAESGVREINLNKFMSHIGKSMPYNYILAVYLP